MRVISLGVHRKVYFGHYLRVLPAGGFRCRQVYGTEPGPADGAEWPPGSAFSRLVPGGPAGSGGPSLAGAAQRCGGLPGLGGRSGGGDGSGASGAASSPCPRPGGQPGLAEGTGRPGCQEGRRSCGWSPGTAPGGGWWSRRGGGRRVGSGRWRANTRTLTCGVLTGEQRWLADVPDDHEQPGSVASKRVGPAAGHAGRLRSCQLRVEGEGGGAPTYRVGRSRVRLTDTTARCGMRSSCSGSGATPRRAWSLWWPVTVPRSLTGRPT